MKPGEYKIKEVENGFVVSWLEEMTTMNDSESFVLREKLFEDREFRETEVDPDSDDWNTEIVRVPADEDRPRKLALLDLFAFLTDHFGHCSNRYSRTEMVLELRERPKGES